jgi:phosphoribosylaminoimidazolecarboxamide formyltransferase/IMP cyclohydrolase
LARFASKKSLRLLEIAPAPADPAKPDRTLKQVSGGFLMQDADRHRITEAGLTVVSLRAPTPDERRALLFAWSVCKHVKSNAIVISKGLQTVGIGAGQTSRVDSVRIALGKAGDRAQGAVLASDAFFPFADGPQLALEAGVIGIIQPGGSVRDHETVETVDRAGAAMVFTSRRHFLH